MNTKISLLAAGAPDIKIYAGSSYNLIKLGCNRSLLVKSYGDDFFLKDGFFG